MKLVAILMLLASPCSYAAAEIQSAEDCTAPEFQLGFVLLDANLNREINQHAAQDLNRSDQFRVVETMSWVQATDGTVHPFDALVLKVNSALSKDESRKAFIGLKKLRGTEVRCMGSGAFKGGEFVL
jgi:hypothetical protein